MQSIVEQNIEEYNNNEHSSLVGLTPNTMEDALVLYSDQTQTGALQEHLSKEGLNIEKIKAKYNLMPEIGYASL